MFVIIEWLFLLFVFFASQLPMRDPDIWFHMKSGQYFVEHGLVFFDPFSFAANGRSWIPFEWLFQIAVYLLSLINIQIIVPIISIFSTLMMYFFLRIMQTIFSVPRWLAILFGFFFFASIYEFYTPRPHILAYTFIMTEFYLIYLFIFKQKRWIYLLPLLTVIWTNVHSTGFLSWGLLLTYFLIAQKKQREILALLATLCAIATVLPPKGFLDYQLLLTFFANREFLGHFIVEWAPISADLFLGFYIYSTYALISTSLFCYLSWKKNLITKNLWALPFFLMITMGFTATRNVPLGMIGSIILLAWSISHIQKKHVFLWVFIFLVSIFHVWLLYAKYTNYRTQRMNYPVAAAEFAKKYLKGRMFNDYNYGGFLLYHVYPELQVFIDGRAEVYQCCEMRDYLMLAVNKNLPDEKYQEFLQTFINAYDFDFFIITPGKHNVMRRIAGFLNTDPNWALVFWDDFSEVFVRRNGKNDAIIYELEAKAATPYLRDPFPKEKMERALYEYERMDSIIASSRTSNAIGYIYLIQNKFDNARTYFERAIDLDPTFESPYMNLAEISARDGNANQAIALYEIARKRAPDRGLIYIRLGQLDPVNAKKIWEEGLIKTVDEDAKAELKQLLLSIRP